MLDSVAGLAFALDLPTLLVIATWLAALLGLFLFLAWISDRTVRALAWWSTAYVIGGSAVAMWSSGHTAAELPLTRELPSALLFLALGMIWTGARLFYGRGVRPLALVAGAMVWLIVTQLPVFASGTPGRLALSCIGISLYTFLTAIEVWRDRRGRPITRCLALVVPVLHASVFLCPVVLPVIVPMIMPHLALHTSSAWFTALTLATLLYAVGTAFLILALVQDRTIRLHKDAASTDPLTGLFNRRAFLDYAQKLIVRCARKHQPVTLLMFDLDHFKQVNDRFGHATGDAALKLFARTASACMRTDDAIGRLGGEEFAAVVPGGEAVAAGIAERIRAAFEVAGVVVDGQPLQATVSIGAAWTADNVDISKVLAAADAALYRAKETGRNRMVLADMPIGGEAQGGNVAAAPASDSAKQWLPPFPVAEWLRAVAARLMPVPHQLRPAELPKQPPSLP
jgi:diguanylate cyclase (GGDEF)-like protein